MSKENTNNLLRMICDPVKRQLLIEFRVIRFCLSNQIKQVVDDNEEGFYQVLSSIKIDKNGYAEVSFNIFRLFISAIELESELDNKQSESTIFLHVVTINEQLESEIEQQDIQEFLNQSGAINIE
tara:strand:+ start:128 stop:502 length:375 start_codon:yes stop_codon:yes gene_type:complete